MRVTFRLLHLVLHFLTRHTQPFAVLRPLEDKIDAGNHRQDGKHVYHQLDNEIVQDCQNFGQIHRRRCIKAPEFRGQ